MKHSENYIWQKMYLAVLCLCGEGSFRERLEGATLALVLLNDEDLTGKLKEDLEYIFNWTNRNIEGGRIRREPGELDRKELIEKMLRVLLDTTEHHAEQQIITESKRHRQN
jgi:hypothetical protein